MSSIADIVETTITREQPLPAGAAFSYVNFVSAQAAFTPKMKLYGSAAEVASDAQAGADTVAFANIYFGQEVRPTRLYVTKKGTDSYVASLDAASLLNDEWYGVAVSSRAEADILAVAAWVEARSKIFIAKTNDVGVPDQAVTDDIATEMKALGYQRTALFYHGDAGTLHVEAAPFGLQLPKRPGSSQFAYKRFAGVPTNPLSVGARNAALAKNANVYTDRAGQGRFESGRMVNGEWIDTIIGIDWVSAEIQQRIYAALSSAEKIPYTDAGVSVVVNEIKAVQQRAVANGIFAATPAPTVSAPLVADISKTDKGNRLLPDIEWEATLAGAIIKAKVKGRVLL